MGVLQANTTKRFYSQLFFHIAIGKWNSLQEASKMKKYAYVTAQQKIKQYFLIRFQKELFKPELGRDVGAHTSLNE